MTVREMEGPWKAIPISQCAIFPLKMWIDTDRDKELLYQKKRVEKILYHFVFIKNVSLSLKYDLTRV